MKRFCFVLCFLLMVISLALPGFAATETGEGSTETETITDSSGEDLGTYVGTSVYALNPVTSSDATGLKAVLLQFIGDWDSIVIEHAYESSNGYTSYVREIQLDYPWLCSAGFLVVVIFCLFRLGGSILCKT